MEREIKKDPAGMIDSGAIIREYRESDFAALVHLQNAAAALTADGHYLTEQAVQESLERPGYCPEDNLYIAEIAGTVVGYMDACIEPLLDRAIVSAYVEPGERRCGLGGMLWRRAMQQVRQAGVGAVHVNVSQKNNQARNVLEGHGFAVVRRFVEMDIDISAPADRAVPIYTIRGMQAHEAACLADIQNRSFSGSWGFSPNTVEEIAYKTSGHDALDGILLAMDGARAAGYCWMGTERSGLNDPLRGRVMMIGVDADYRSLGVGRDLLRAGLAYARNAGLKSVRLTVDVENRTAHSLYSSMGFVDGEFGLWYEKRLS